MNCVTYHLPYPRHSLRPLFDEALGRTNNENEYVYLSDGGHFENIGLYEMVRRRCRIIVISDATCDPKCGFDDIANSIRKIRTDFGIPVEIEKHSFITSGARDRATDVDGCFCAVGKIKYSEVDGIAPTRDGLIIYFKPGLRKKQPLDVYNYSQSSEAFPHEPTSDQWFSESQFESYRRLGEESVDALYEKDNVTRAEAAAGKKAPANETLQWLYELAASHAGESAGNASDASADQSAASAAVVADAADETKRSARRARMAVRKALAQARAVEQSAVSLGAVEASLALTQTAASASAARAGRAAEDAEEAAGKAGAAARDASEVRTAAASAQEAAAASAARAGKAAEDAEEAAGKAGAAAQSAKGLAIIRKILQSVQFGEEDSVGSDVQPSSRVDVKRNGTTRKRRRRRAKRLLP